MDYVEKPFTEDELRQFVRHALIRRRDRIEKQLKARVHVMGAAEADRGAGREFSIPGGVLVSPGHVWASLAQDGTARIGPDDFARKLLGRVDAIGLPEVGQSVRAGDTLFSIRQGDRQVQFRAPLSGKVVRVNPDLAANNDRLDNLSYARSWVCVVEGENLDTELPQLKIGRSAVNLFQEDIERFKAFVEKTGGSEVSDPASLCIGAFEQFDDARWESAAREFFGR
jgi:glycine cleavage system H protein